MYNTCLTYVMVSDVIPPLQAKHRVNMFRQDIPEMVCWSERPSFACSSNNKNVLHEGISRRHSILNKEMLFCKTLVIDLLTAMRHRICMFFK